VGQVAGYLRSIYPRPGTSRMTSLRHRLPESRQAPLRLYWPKTEAPSILPPGEGTWQPPGVKRVS